MKNDIEDEMPELDFSNAKRNRNIPHLASILKENEGKERITIRLDAAVLAWFRDQVKGGGNYQTLINEALRSHVQDADGSLERTIRRVIREELNKAA